MEEKQTLEYNFQDLLPIGLVVVTLVIALAYGADIVQDVSSDMGAGTAAKNITVSGLTSLDALGDKIPTVVGVLIAAVIIGVVMSFMRQ
jgi:hypothetical protein